MRWSRVRIPPGSPFESTLQLLATVMRDYGYPCPYSRFGCREKISDYSGGAHLAQCRFRNGSIDLDDFLRNRRRALLIRSWPLAIPALVALAVALSIVRFHLPHF